MSSKKGRKVPRVEDIDPSLLPPEITRVGPHEHIDTYFEAKDRKICIEQWSEFYEKRPLLGVKELVESIIFVSGVKYTIDEGDFKKVKIEKVEEDVKKLLEDSDGNSEIYKYLSGKNSDVHDFWVDIGNGLIVCKGLYKNEFDSFKSWIFKFCDTYIRPLRQAATVAILTLTEFLAESITKSTEGIRKLKKADSMSSVKKHQMEGFIQERDSARSLSMEFFTTVIKMRINDVDPTLRALCIQTTSKLSDICPEQFENDNFLKYIGSALLDDNQRVKKEALKLNRALLDRSKDNTDLVAPFFKRNITNIVRLCDDSENSVAISAFELLTELASKKMLREVEKTEVVFKITADTTPNVRNAASKFFSKVLFSEKVKNGEQQELYERHLRKLASLCSEMSYDSIENCVEAHWKHLKALQEFELIVQILISSDENGENTIFSHIMAASASIAGQKEHKSVKDMTTSIVGHFTEIYEKYGDNEEIISDFISTTEHFDLSAIEQAAGYKQMKDFLKQMKNLFKANSNKIIYYRIIKSLSRWKKAKNTPTKIKKDISNIVIELVKEYSKPESDRLNYQKLLSLLEFEDLSTDEEIRDMLKESSDNGDEDISAIALECLENIFKWDVLRIRNDEEASSEYTGEYNNLSVLFSSKIYNNNQSVKRSAFKCISTILSLHQLIHQEVIDDATTSMFYKSFHELDNKKELINHLTRPIICGTTDPKYAVHILWYIQDDDLKASVRSFISEVPNIFPVDGYELGDLVRKLKYNPIHIKSAMKTLSSKIDPRGVIDSWLDQPDDSLIPIYEPFIRNLDSLDADLLKDRADELTKALLQKRAMGKAFTQKDFIVKNKTKASPNINGSSSESESTENENSN